jgi:hypothetical protein
LERREGGQYVRVREATLEDRTKWDTFVDDEGGSFFHYYDWKYVYEAGWSHFIPLVVEADPSQLVGILPVARKKRLLCSTLDSLPEGASGGYLLKRELRDQARHEAISALLECVDTNLSGGCSTFTLNENLTLADRAIEHPTAALVSKGFRFRFDTSTRLPCTHVLELRPPFEENVWKRWSRPLRQEVNKAARSGVVVIQDREFQHAEVFANMLRDVHRRHGSKPPTRDEIKTRLDVFRGRSKLFVALLDGRPIVILLCHYTRSTCHLAKAGTYEKDTGSANKLCYKVAIEDAFNSGYKFVDLGMSLTPSLAFLKERFGAARVPMRIYEKSYSVPRTLIEKAPVLVSSAWHDRNYIWTNRRKIWDRIVHI